MSNTSAVSSGSNKTLNSSRIDGSMYHSRFKPSQAITTSDRPSQLTSDQAGQVKYVCCGVCHQWLLTQVDSQYVFCPKCENVNYCSQVHYIIVECYIVFLNYVIY
jgi:hypothetical protein